MEVYDQNNEDKMVTQEGTIIERCNDELERLQANLEMLEKKLHPVLSMSSEKPGGYAEEAPRNALHALEIRIRALNNRLNGLMYEIEL